MSYKRISGKPTESLERDLSTTFFGGTMKEGTHTVEVETVIINDDSADIEFKNNFGETIRQRFFFANFNKTDMSYLFKQLVASGVEDASGLWAIQDDPTRISILVGSKVRLDIGNNGGQKFTRVPEGFKAGRYTAETLTELRQALAQDQIKMYRTEIQGVYSNDDSNKDSEDKPATGSDTNTPDTRRRRQLPAHLQF